MKQEKEIGYVYVMTNPSLRDNYIKIGKTIDPHLRIKELSGTSLPKDYELYVTIKTKMYSEVEKFMHNILDILTPTRINKKREFFNIDPKKVSIILEGLSKLIPDSTLEYFGDVVVSENKDKPKGERFDFYKKGLKKGDIIEFIDDSKVTAIVENNREVLFEGKKYKLSPLVYELYKRKNKLNKSGAYQGPAYFTYKGIKLTDI